MLCSMVRRLSVSAAIGVLLFSSVALADQKEECVTAYTKAQELRSDAKLREAREQLLTCAQSACPDFIKRDCSKWLGEVEATLPTVVFSAKLDGKDLTDVRVRSGDKVISESIDGRAVPWDPGSATFVFENDELGEKEVTLIVKEGQKAQSVEAVFESKTSGGSAGGSAKLDTGSADDKTLAYVLGGVGLVGLGGFAYFGLSGNSDKSSLACADTKTCTDEDLDPIKKKYLFADISLGVGVVSLGVATYLLLSPSSLTSYGQRILAPSSWNARSTKYSRAFPAAHPAAPVFPPWILSHRSRSS